jgi:molecular chaperone IbpA
MSRDDFSRLFGQLESLSVGFGPVFRDFQSPTVNYPPHNIVQLSETEFQIELAIAGFKKSEINIEIHEGVLTIKGTKGDAPLNQYQHRGIAARSFIRNFRIAEYYEVVDADLEDGILVVKFIKNIPDSAKPKVINIK